MKMKPQKAFTLIEMIIAITVFTIFIGFSISSFLAFHRADQEAVSTRSLMLEAEAAMNVLSEAVRENKIKYEEYDEDSGSLLDLLSANRLGLSSTLGLAASDALNTSELILESADGETTWRYAWDEALSVQTCHDDENGNEECGDASLLHAETTTVSYANFSIFPAVDPFDPANTDDDVQYQPHVQIDLTFETPGRVREMISIDLHTTVTSRFYQ